MPAHAEDTHVRSLDQVRGVIKSQEGRTFYDDQMSGISPPPAFKPLDLNSAQAREILNAVIPAELKNLRWNFLDIQPWRGNPGHYIATTCTALAPIDPAAAQPDGKQTCADFYQDRAAYTAVVAVLKQENGRYVPAAAPHIENTADAYSEGEYARAAGLRSKAEREGRATGFSLADESGNTVAGELVRYDFAPYQLNPATRAFGLRIGAQVAYSGGGAYNQAVSLFAVIGGRLQPVLTVPVYAFSDTAGEWNADGTRQHHLFENASVLVMGQPHEGYRDIILRQSGKKPARARYLPLGRENPALPVRLQIRQPERPSENRSRRVCGSATHADKETPNRSGSLKTRFTKVKTPTPPNGRADMKPHALTLAAALAAAPAYATEIFDAPGGGISCLGDDDLGVHPEYGVFCTLAGRTRFARYEDDAAASDTANPEYCEQGTMFILRETGRAHVLCTIPDHPDGLGLLGKIKGETVKGKGWQCSVRPSGIRCANPSGHGFEINREKQRLF